MIPFFGYNVVTITNTITNQERSLLWITLYSIYLASFKTLLSDLLAYSFCLQIYSFDTSHLPCPADTPETTKRNFYLFLDSEPKVKYSAIKGGGRRQKTNISAIFKGSLELFLTPIFHRLLYTTHCMIPIRSFFPTNLKNMTALLFHVF